MSGEIRRAQTLPLSHFTLTALQEEKKSDYKCRWACFSVGVCVGAHDVCEASLVWWPPPPPPLWGFRKINLHVGGSPCLQQRNVRVAPSLLVCQPGISSSTQSLTFTSLPFVTSPNSATKKSQPCNWGEQWSHFFFFFFCLPFVKKTWLIWPIRAKIQQIQF